MTKARDIATLLSTANGKIAGNNLDVSFENITDTGTTGTRVATGTTAQRGSTAGQLRFNTTTGLAEYYNGSAFKAIDSPPTISSIDVTEVDSQAGGNQTIVITGSGFNSGAIVTFVGNSGTDFNASTVTVDSDTQITAVAPKASFLNAQEPYGVKVENVSGLSATLASQINVDTSPSWQTASGTIYTGNDITNVSVTVSATDADGDTISYSETTSVLSGAGLSLNSSTGVISGTPTGVASDTTYTFTLRATAGGKTSDRQFSIVITNAVVQTFSYTGSNQTWTVPSGVTSATIKLWGAGGGSDSTGSGQYGAGGGFAEGTVSLTPSSTMYLVVGQGGALGTYGGSGGSGGGYSGLFSSSVSHANAIIIAGGGGGAGDNNRGGVGGGLTGTQGDDDSPQYNNGGRGGTQSAGGDAGNVGYSSASGVLPTAGSALQGGDGGGDNGAGRTYTPASYGGGGRGGYEPGGSQGGGGGGGGYYGGGGGDGNAYGANGGGGAGGGGGSSYLHPSLITNGSTISGSTTSSGGASDPYYSSNIGDAGTDRAGGNGKIVIIY